MYLLSALTTLITQIKYSDCIRLIMMSACRLGQFRCLTQLAFINLDAKVTPNSVLVSISQPWQSAILLLLMIIVHKVNTYGCYRLVSWYTSDRWTKACRDLAERWWQKAEKYFDRNLSKCHFARHKSHTDYPGINFRSPQCEARGTELNKIFVMLSVVVLEL